MTSRCRILTKTSGNIYSIDIVTVSIGKYDSFIFLVLAWESVENSDNDQLDDHIFRFRGSMEPKSSGNACKGKCFGQNPLFSPPVNGNSLIFSLFYGEKKVK